MVSQYSGTNFTDCNRFIQTLYNGITVQWYYFFADLNRFPQNYYNGITVQWYHYY